MDDNTFVCRCEEVTLSEVKSLIEQGYTTIDEIKRLCRCSMGPCGGKTCGSILINELAKANKVKPADIKQPTCRPPAKNIRMELLARAGDEE